MGTATGTYSGRTNHRLRIETQLASQNIAGNYSTINFQIYSEKTSASSSYYLSNGGGGSYNIGGNTGSLPAWLYDFRSNTTYTRATGSVNVGHNPDGTAAYSFSASDTAPGSLGSASASGSEGLPTIPRASNSTFTPQPIDAGAGLTISTNPASTGFTHNLAYFFGAASGTIANGVSSSATWTVPLSLLNEIPNSASGTGYIRTETYSGATLIGSTNAALTVNASAGIVPTFTSVTASENVSAVSTLVGAYVQGLSKLNLAIVGAVGVYGSTISSYKIDVAGQTINVASGVTPAVIASSGTVPVVAVITDSRGRTATQTLNLTFLAYAPPAIDAAVYSTKRALSDGTLNESGTYIRVDLKASSSSLLVSSAQKNNLTYKIYTRLRGDAAWTLKTTVTPTGVTFNSFDKVGIYAVENSWDVRIDVLDRFNTATIASTVATASIFMHWGPLGLGLGKFWETGRGAVDVKGQIYQNDGRAVIDEVSLRAAFFASSFGRNRIRNGDFRVNQRNIVSGSVLGGVFGFDGWKCMTATTRLDWTPAPQGQTLQMSWSGSDTYAMIQQVIERANMPAGTYTISWVGTATVRASNVSVINTAPSFGNSPYTFTVNGAEDVCVQFITNAGLGTTVGQVQLNVGSVPAPFERISYRESLSECQRYYFRHTPTAANEVMMQGSFFSSSPQAVAQRFLPVTMRAVPTVNLSGTPSAFTVHQPGNAITGASGLNASNQYQSAHSIEIQFAVSSAAGFTNGGMVKIQSNGTGQWIEASAEL